MVHLWPGLGQASQAGSLRTRQFEEITNAQTKACQTKCVQLVKVSQTTWVGNPAVPISHDERNPNSNIPTRERKSTTSPTLTKQEQRASKYGQRDEHTETRNKCENNVIWHFHICPLFYISFPYLFHIFGLGTQIWAPKVIFLSYSWSYVFHIVFTFLYMPELGPCPFRHL